MTVNVEASLARRVQVMRAALEEIEAKLPPCSEEAETTWSNRVWNGEFRKLQAIARAALKAAKGAA
ncbi:hypothetical protein [Amaricoccus sp.]|uniref:hypothetical protein n=1 Tax=Amaricoccus sp. TaxID=1872485 RepID=UPI001B555C94|nr:hypothetical protein [Amaricoccus sp.]MBP7243207.1 hypothetical protein [Amaricoccus sp.]